MVNFSIGRAKQHNTKRTSAKRLVERLVMGGKMEPNEIKLHCSGGKKSHWIILERKKVNITLRLDTDEYEFEAH